MVDKSPRSPLCSPFPARTQPFFFSSVVMSPLSPPALSHLSLPPPGLLLARTLDPSMESPVLAAYAYKLMLFFIPSSGGKNSVVMGILSHHGPWAALVVRPYPALARPFSRPLSRPYLGPYLGPWAALVVHPYPALAIYISRPISRPLLRPLSRPLSLHSTCVFSPYPFFQPIDPLSPSPRVALLLR